MKSDLVEDFDRSHALRPVIMEARLPGLNTQTSRENQEKTVFINGGFVLCPGRHLGNRIEMTHDIA